MAQFVIRNHSEEWRNCVGRLGAKFGTAKNVCNRLLVGDLTVSDSNVQEEIERFVNLRLPTHIRNIQSLTELQKMLKEPLEAENRTFDLIEILWPRERNPSGDRTAETEAASMGVQVISVPPGSPREMHLDHFLGSGEQWNGEPT